MLINSEWLKFFRAKQYPLTNLVVQDSGMSLCRDGFHMSFLYGRFVLACCWAKVLLGVTLSGTDRIPSTVAVKDTANPALIAQIKAMVDRLIG